MNLKLFFSLPYTKIFESKHEQFPYNSDFKWILAYEDRFLSADVSMRTGPLGDGLHIRLNCEYKTIEKRITGYYIADYEKIDNKILLINIKTEHLIETVNT